MKKKLLWGALILVLAFAGYWFFRYMNWKNKTETAQKLRFVALPL